MSGLQNAPFKSDRQLQKHLVSKRFVSGIYLWRPDHVHVRALPIQRLTIYLCAFQGCNGAKPTRQHGQAGNSATSSTVDLTATTPVYPYIPTPSSFAARADTQHLNTVDDSIVTLDCDDDVDTDNNNDDSSTDTAVTQYEPTEAGRMGSSVPSLPMPLLLPVRRGHKQHPSPP